MCAVRTANLTFLNFTTTTERGLRVGAWGLGPGPGSTDILRVRAEYGPGSNDTNQTLHKTSRVFSIHSLRKKNSIKRYNVTSVAWNDQSVTTGLHLNVHIMWWFRQQPVTWPCPRPVQHLPIPLLQIHFNIILPSTLRYSNLFPPLGYLQRNFFLIPNMSHALPISSSLYSVVE